MVAANPHPNTSEVIMCSPPNPFLSSDRYF
jgi:hypothetical protein